MDQLERRTGDKVRLLVVAWRPEGSNWKPETALPVWVDEGGGETRRFGVTTSGHAMIFDAEGRAIFTGGLTARRGEDSLLEEGLPKILEEANEQRRRRGVFGCGLEQVERR